MDRAPLGPADIAALKAPASFKAICLLCLNVRGGTLLMHTPPGMAKLKSGVQSEGRTLAFGDGAGPTVEIVVRDATFARRVLLHGDIGFAEGFMAREWDTPDLPAMLTFISANADRLMSLLRGNVFSRSVNFVRHMTR